MKKLLRYFSAMALLVALSCEDSEKDPIQFDKLKKGSILVLRGGAFDNLLDSGCPDSFQKASTAGETFDFDAEFISEDINSLQEVRLFATRFTGGAREQVATSDASIFAVQSGSKYPSGSFSIPLNTILTALNISDATTLDKFDLIIEADITLKDGTVVPASSVVNNGLYESGHFYPAHFLFYCAE